MPCSATTRRSLTPDYARAWRLRGDAFKAKGDYGRAIKDYDQSIKLKPKDFDQAITLKPDHAIAIKIRGRTHFYLGHFAEAAADPKRGASLDSTNAYVAIWQHMATKRLGQDNMTEFTAQLARTDSVKWPAPVAHFYLGRLTADQLMASAAQTDSKAQSEYQWARAELGRLGKPVT